MKNVTSHKQRLIDLLDDCGNATILDYGCGNGDFIELLLNANSKPKKIVAVDSNEDMLANVRRRFSANIDAGVVTTKLVLSPAEVQGKFDKIICHNVLECIENKLDFINSFKPLMTENSILVLSHHDFDSVIFNSSYKELSRNLVHHFSDTKQKWMKYSDGQIGRKIPGLINHSEFRNYSKHATWRLVDTVFEPGKYGHLVADMFMEVCKDKFSDTDMQAWHDDLAQKNKLGEYYFAIDLVVSVCRLNAAP